MELILVEKSDGSNRKGLKAKCSESVIRADSQEEGAFLCLQEALQAEVAGLEIPGMLTDGPVPRNEYPLYGIVIRRRVCQRLSSSKPTPENPMSTTLLVLAAGMGSRYGGLKQIDPVGPNGEVILDYSVYDAIRAGMDRVVLVIRREIEAAFREAIGKRLEAKVRVDYAFQELDDLPTGFSVPAGRSKPWGTTHAVLAAREQILEPFGVINADDFYGAESFRLLADSLSAGAGREGEYTLVGFPLRNTVSPHGTVSRGLCDVDAAGYLQSVRECHEIRPGEGGISLLRGEERLLVDGSQTVSMNLWGFNPDFLGKAQESFAAFLKAGGAVEKSECYLPATVQEWMDRGGARVKVLQTPESWLGVTYPEDKPLVKAGLQGHIAAGLYPENLWG